MASRTPFTPTEEDTNDMYESHHTRDRPPQLNMSTLPTATASTPRTESSDVEDVSSNPHNETSNGADSDTPIRDKQSLWPSNNKKTPLFDLPLFPDTLSRAYVYYYGTADVLNIRPPLTDSALQAHDNCNANTGHSFNVYGWRWGISARGPEGRSESLMVSGRTRTQVTEVTTTALNNATPINPGIGDGDVCYTGAGFDDSIIPLGTKLDDHDLYEL